MSNILFKLALFFIVAIFTPISSFAQTYKTPKKSVSQLLQKVKQSKGDERRKAMNALKLKLRTVNADTRAKTMQELRQAFASIPTHTTTTRSVHSVQQLPHKLVTQPHPTSPGIKPPPPVQKPLTPSTPVPSPIPSPGGHP